MKTKLFIIASIVLIVSLVGCTDDSDFQTETNSKNLFLASYFPYVAALLPDFVGEDLTGKVVAHIPTAAMQEKGADADEIIM